MYLTDSENYGRDSVARQYFMQLAQYVKLPMISWNADNSAFEMGSLQVKNLTNHFTSLKFCAEV